MGCSSSKPAAPAIAPRAVKASEEHVSANAEAAQASDQKIPANVVRGRRITISSSSTLDSDGNDAFSEPNDCSEQGTEEAFHMEDRQQDTEEAFHMEDRQKGKADDATLYSYGEALIPKKSLGQLKAFARNDLGEDPSSVHFVRREKCIAFVYFKSNEVYRLDQDFFVQNEEYNDFSGGYRRHYKLIPQHIVKFVAKEVILQFCHHFGIPDGIVMLVQIQSSIIDPLPAEARKGQASRCVTGQGIHTDGSSQAMLMCLERTNVDGAKNLFFEDLDGTRQLGEGRVLQEGDVAFFRDDSIYHYVSPISQDDASVQMRRSMLLIHAPAEHYLTGVAYEGNKGGTNGASIKLREEPAQEASI